MKNNSRPRPFLTFAALTAAALAIHACGPGDPEKSKPARDYKQLTQAIQHALSRPGPNGQHPSNPASTGRKK